MTVEIFIIWVLIGFNIIVTIWNFRVATQYWVAMNQRNEMADAISEEAKRRVSSGDTITWYHLFDELKKVRLADHTLMLATFRDPYKLYPPYIRRLVGK